MIAISTAWLYTYQLNSSFAFFILFLPITTCSYKCLTNMHWVFYTAFNGEHLNGFHKVNEAVINNTAGKPVKRLQGKNYREENVLGMYFPYEISSPVHICKIYIENYSSTVWKYLCFLRQILWQVSTKNQNHAMTSKKCKKLKTCIIVLHLLTPECELEETQEKYLEEYVLLGSCCDLRKSGGINCRWPLTPTKSSWLKLQANFFLLPIG